MLCRDTYGRAVTILPSIDHDELRGQAAAYALGALTAGQGARFEAHLASCAECAEEVESLWPIVRALTGAAPPADPPLALRDRVLASLGSPERNPATDRPR